jgi:hypothetical protein
MTKEILKEGLDYHDLKGQIEPRITVDEYKAKMGKDSDVVTVAFTVNSKLAGTDLVSWLEIGYDYVLDASISEGEVEPGKYLVFVEMDRRTKVPERIVELLNDLETLTDIQPENYTIVVDDTDYKADVDSLKNVIILSPHEYRSIKEKEEELNEFRTNAGLETKILHDNDSYIKYVKSLAGI